MWNNFYNLKREQHVDLKHSTGQKGIVNLRHSIASCKHIHNIFKWKRESSTKGNKFLWHNNNFPILNKHNNDFSIFQQTIKTKLIFPCFNKQSNQTITHFVVLLQANVMCQNWILKSQANILSTTLQTEITKTQQLNKFKEKNSFQYYLFMNM